MVPLQSAFYRYGATRNSDAFSDSALNAAPPNTAYADLIRYCIIPGAPAPGAAPRAGSPAEADALARVDQAPPAYSVSALTLPPCPPLPLPTAVPIKCTCDLADQQQLTTSLPGAPPLTVFIDPSNPSTVLLTSTFGHSQIVRKNILGACSRGSRYELLSSPRLSDAVCGGGSVQVTDAVIPPYAM